jgi:ABC-type phosphate transport system substrate-binding protein
MERSTFIQTHAVAAFWVLLALGTPASAAPPEALYFGGDTSGPEMKLRDLMNCYGDHSGTDTEARLIVHACNTGDAGFLGPYRPGVGVLYAGSGETNGEMAWWNHDAGSNGFTSSGRVPNSTPVPSTLEFGPYYGMGVGSSWIPGTNSPFPTVTGAYINIPFSIGDVVDPGKYLDNAAANNWGAPIQLPDEVGALALSYMPVSGTWVENGKKPAGPVGTFSRLSLSTNTWCGIMTGAITEWEDPAITADNGKKVITTGTATAGTLHQINVAVRGDGSTSTWTMVNAMLAQCSASAYPVPISWQTAPGNTSGATNLRWFINVASAARLPPNFTSVTGNYGLRDYVLAHPGSIGYLQTDLAQPVYPAGPPTANLQTWHSFVGGLTPVYKQPNYKSALAIVATLIPPSFVAGSCTTNTSWNYGTSYDGICAHNAVNWGQVTPAPVSSSAYPIGGFGFLLLYSCYEHNGITDLGALVGAAAPAGYLRWSFTTATKPALIKHGFSPIPGKWMTAAKTLLFTDTQSKIGYPGQATTACAGLSASGGA